MSSRKKNTFIHLLFSYLNIGTAFVNGILIVPFYLIYIDHATYGAWLATGNILAWLTIADPGTSNVTIQRISKSSGNENREILAQQVASSIVTSFIASSICLIVGLSLSGYVTDIINLSEDQIVNDIRTAFQLAMVGVAISLFNYSVYAILIGLQQQFYTGLARIVGRIIGIAVSVTMVIKGHGIKSVALGVLVTNVIDFSLNVFFLKKIGAPFKFSKRYFKAYIRIFSLTFSSRIFAALYQNIDLVLVARLFSPEVVAQLEITRRPMKFVQGFLVAPSKSLMPTLANYIGHYKPKKASELIQKLLIGFFCIFLIAGLAFMMFNQNLIEVWVGSDLFIGKTENIVLSLGLIVLMWNYMLSNINVSLGNIRGESYSQIATGILGIILLFAFGHLFGLIGIIIAPIISILLCQTWYFIKYINTKVNLSKHFSYELIKVAVVGFATYFFMAFINQKLADNYEVNYWILATEAIVLVAALVLLYLAIIKPFRVLVFKDVLSAFLKNR